MERIRISIQGKTPLLMNRFTDEAQLSASSGTRAAIATNSRTPKEVAATKLYRTDEGLIGIPQPNLFRCLIDAGKFFKVGKSKVTTQKSSLIPACIDVSPIFILLGSEEGWTVDSRPVRIPATGGRIVAHRPIFNDWMLTFSAEVDTDTMTVGLFRDVVDAAGSKIGLGDFRPDCKGPFGKFVVVYWNEEPDGD